MRCAAIPAAHVACPGHSLPQPQNERKEKNDSSRKRTRADSSHTKNACHTSTPTSSCIHAALHSIPLTGVRPVIRLRQKVHDRSRCSHLIGTWIAKAFAGVIPRCALDVHAVDKHPVGRVTSRILKMVHDGEREEWGVIRSETRVRTGCSN